MRLTLRTLLAYLDDTLPADEAKLIGQKVSESETAQQLVETISRVTRRRGLSTPPTEGKEATDPNTVAEYLSDVLSAEQISDFENLCLESDVHLAEVAACHQILTLLLSEPVRVPPSARQRMYRLVKGPESLPNKKPSNTIPIGGILPDETLPSSDDSDAGYLLGMKAFSETETRGQQLAKIALLAGLLGGLGLSVYAAWPTGRQSEIAQAGGTGTLRTFVPPQKPVEEKGEKPAAFVPPDNPMAPPRDPNEAPPMEPMKVVEPPMPVVEMPVKDNSPRLDVLPVAKLETPEKVLVVYRNGKWVRIGGVPAELSSGEKLVALPGYASVLKLDTGADLTLWGNLPEHSAVPIRETSITAYLPRDGFAADLKLHAGRIYLTGVKPNLQQLRVRTENEFWDITLQDAQTEVAVEVSEQLVSGGNAEPNPNEKPRTEITIAVLTGRAKLMREGQLPLDLILNEYITTNSVDKRIAGPKRVGVAPGVDASHFSRNPPPVGDPLWARAVQEMLGDFAENYKPSDPLRVRLEEYYVAQQPPPDESKLRMFKRTLRGSFATAALAAEGRYETVLSALNDDARPRVREAAAEALVWHPSAVLEQWASLSQQLKEKNRFTEDQIRQFYQLLRTQNSTDAATLDFLIDTLNSPRLQLRELAYWHLNNNVDPESKSVKLLSGYDAAATPEARESATKAWKKRVEELKQRKPKS